MIPEPVEQGAYQPLTTQDLGPSLEREIRGDTRWAWGEVTIGERSPKRALLPGEFLEEYVEAAANSPVRLPKGDTQSESIRLLMDQSPFGGIIKTR